MAKSPTTPTPDSMRDFVWYFQSVFPDDLSNTVVRQTVVMYFATLVIGTVGYDFAGGSTLLSHLYIQCVLPASVHDVIWRAGLHWLPT